MENKVNDAKQGCPHIPLSAHFLQLLQVDAEPGDVLSL